MQVLGFLRLSSVEKVLDHDVRKFPSDLVLVASK